MKGIKYFHLVLLLSALLILPSCGGGGPQTGSLSLTLGDASTDDYKAVYVTIAEVQVHTPGGGWKVVGAPNKTYNLLDLVNGVREELGIAELEAGDYTQMRLIIGDTPDGGINILSQQHPYANYVIDLNDDVHELKVPSGYQSGFKIVQGFTISPNETTELILDFNASESIVIAGSSGNWLLQPTVKVLNTQEYSIISGKVDDSAGVLAGVLVSAQISDSSASDAKDQVVIEASTVTDENGQYKLFLEPGMYNIVVYKLGYDPVVEYFVKLEAGNVVNNYNFTLTSASTGTVSGSVSITGVQTDQYVTISLRQSESVQYQGNPVTEIFEVKSVNVAVAPPAPGTYTIPLTVGSYDMVASSYGEGTQEVQVTVSANTVTSAQQIILTSP
jgi:hypothetical protein